MTIEHKTKTVQPNDPAKDISANAWNEEHNIVDGIVLPVETVAVPPANHVKLFGRSIGGRSVPAFVGSSGLDSALQASFARNRVSMWLANGNSTVVTSFGLAATAGSGATAATVIGTGTLHQAMRRLDYLITTPTTSAVAFLMPTGTVNQLFRGTGILGGFHVVMRFGGATGMANTSHRFFAGLHGTAGNPTDAFQPSGYENSICAAYDSTDTNWKIMHKTGNGSVTKIDLPTFPRQTVDREKMYELALFCPPAGSWVRYEFTELGTSNVATGQITTNLPAPTTIIRPTIFASVGGVSSVIGIAVSSVYIETDY